MPSIVLIGYRGTGKSTVARLMAERLGLPAFDADVELERRAGKTIKQVFDEQGEGAFRELEVAVVADLAARNDCVLALGGGAVMRAENRQAIAPHRVIWLAASPEAIWDRISTDAKSGDQRPNLTVRGGIEEIEELLAAREPTYRQCSDLHIDTDGRTPEQVAEDIVCLLGE